MRVVSGGGMLYVVGRVRQPEKRKVDSSILSLTTSTYINDEALSRLDAHRYHP